MQVYSEISKDPYKSSADDDVTALTGVKNKHFPDLKEWLQLHVMNNKV